MAYFPDVQPGDRFEPNALLSNNVRHMLNRMDGFTGGVAKETPFNNTVVQVYCQEELKPGTAVNFKDGEKMINDAIPCEAFNNPLKPWGIVTRGLQPDGIGECIVSGAVKVKISGEIKNYALPNIKNPQEFESSDTGAFVLYRSRTSRDAIIRLNGRPKEVGYNGFFKVEVEKISESDFRARVVAGGTKPRDYCGIITYLGDVIKVPVTEFRITEETAGIVLLFDCTKNFDLDIKLRPTKPDDFWKHDTKPVANWQTTYLCYFNWRKEKNLGKIEKHVDVIQLYELYTPLPVYIGKYNWVRG